MLQRQYFTSNKRDRASEQTDFNGMSIYDSHDEMEV